MKLLRHEPSRGVGGATDKREAFTSRAELPSGGNSVSLTEDVRKYLVEQGESEQDAFEKGMAAKSAEFVQTGIELYKPADVPFSVTHVLKQPQFTYF
jgi:hypothetical protein